MDTSSGDISIDTQKIIESFSTNWINIAIVIAAMIAIVLVIYFVSKKLRRVIEKRIGDDKREIRRRTFTLNSVISNLVITLTIFIGVLIILDMLGISITPIIAGAGIIGIVVGLGAQSLIKDLINGSFIIIEQWFQINDVVSVGNITGTVEKISLRTTVLRDLDGVVHFIPNSEIKILSNKTQKWALAVVEIGVHYKENTDRVVQVLDTVFDEMIKDKKYKKYFLEKPTVMGDGGVNELGDSSVIFKIICKVTPDEQWTIERQLRKRIKDKFDEVGIEIPFPCRNLYMRED
jgi:small conductance mechanosensitive channel